MELMVRGQLSIDVLFAIIAVAIFFAVLVNTYNDRLNLQVNEQNSLNEAKSILLDSYSALGAVQAYAQSVNYVSPIPRQTANLNLPCTITKTGSGANYTLTVISGGQTVSYGALDLSLIKFKTTTAPITEVQSFNCGTSITACNSRSAGC